MRGSRRTAAEHQVDLRKIRRWWADEPGDAEGQDAQESNSSKGKIEELPDWVQQMIRDLRHEAAGNRVALKEQEKQAREREQARLVEEGKWKELAESRANELAQYQPYKERAETLEAQLRAHNEARIKRVPEDMRTIIPTEYAPEKLSAWLDANESKLVRPPAPDLDAGAGRGGAGSMATIKLTPEQKQLAEQARMTPEQYAAQLKNAQEKSAQV